MDPVTMAAIGMGVGGVTQLAGSLLSSDKQPNYEKIARQNREAQAQENDLQRQFARELMARSTPKISQQDLYQLLFSQGEQAYNQQNQRNLTQVLANNARTGASSSANQELINRFSQGAADTRGDRAVDARLKAITGTLPGAAAIQSAASLYNNNAPQMQFTPPQINSGDRLAAIGYAIPGITNNILDLYNRGTTTSNKNTGGFGNLSSGIGG